jgi:(2Fe-2S) ferredoxin
MKKLEAPEKVIYICNGKKCGHYCKEIRKGFKAEVKAFGMKKSIDIVRMDCTDNCKNAPVISLQPQNVWIGEVEQDEIAGIFKKYFLRDKLQ